MKDVNVHSYNMSGGSKKVYNLLVVNDLWFQHPLLEERQQNLRVFTVEIYRREEIQNKKMPEKYFVKVMKEIESLIKYDIEIVLFCDHISSFIQSSLSSSKALKMED